MELATALGLPKSTVYYHEQMVDDRGYLISTDAGYELSLKFLKLGEGVQKTKVISVLHNDMSSS